MLKKLTSALMIIMILCTMTLIPAMAKTESGEIDVFLHSIETKEPIPDAQIEVYKVAYYPNGESMELTPEFSGTGITMDTLIEHKAEDIIDAFAETHDIGYPVALDNSNSEGWVYFKDLPDGVYYIKYNPNTETQHRSISVSSVVVTLPYLNGNKNARTAEIRPKCEIEALTNVSVTKVWDDKGYEEKRPDSVTVKLLQNGEVIDTFVISEKTSWQHTWINLGTNYTYSVQETKVPSYYKITVTEPDTNNFVIKNTYAPNGGPATDDTANLGMYIGISVFCAAMCAAIIVFMVKRNKRKEA